MHLSLTLIVLSCFGSVELHQDYISSSNSTFTTIFEGSSLKKVKRSVTQTKDCHVSSLPAMDEFNIEKFSGTWYELAKTSSNYFDTNDGVWKIVASNDSSENHKFIFGGRSKKNRCMRPVPGIIRLWDSNPGILTLKYKTHSTYVSEVIILLYTDYESTAVFYACAFTDNENNSCYPDGLFGSIWTRYPHVNIRVFQNAAKVLESACIDKSMLEIRNLIGPCRIQDIGSRSDSYPVPNFCYHAMDPGGPCKDTLKRYYFDPKAMKCKPFIFSGCGGNGNNFILQAECENQCIGDNSNPQCDGEAPCALLCPPCCIRDTNGCVKCHCGSFRDSTTIDPCQSIPDKCPKDCKLGKDIDGCDYCFCEKDTTTDDGSGKNTTESPISNNCLSERNKCPNECKPGKDRNGCFQCLCKENITIGDEVWITPLEPRNQEHQSTPVPETGGGHLRLTIVVPVIVVIIVIASLTTIIIVFMRMKRNRRIRKE